MTDTNTVDTMKSIEEKVADKLRGEFADLIPDEVWKELAQKQRHYVMTELYPKIFKEEAEKKIRANVKAILDADDMAAEFDDQGQRLATELMKKVVVDNAQEIMLSAFGPALYSISQNIRNSILNY